MPQAPGYARNRQGLRRAVGGSVLIFLLAGGVASYAGQVELVSGSDPSNPSSTPNGASLFSSLSADGRYVVFTSEAVNVIPEQMDTNGGPDVFLRDQIGGTTVLVSRSSDSANSVGNAPSSRGQISADGRYVVFQSLATNLVTNQVDTSNTADLFLYDRVTGSTSLVSRSSASARSVGNGPSTTGTISADGRWIVFSSTATDLVSGQADTNAASDVFLYDRLTGATALVSRSAGLPTKAGNDASTVGSFSISADGSQIIFSSSATDLVAGGTNGEPRGQLFLFNRLSGTTTLVSHPFGMPTSGVTFGVEESAISADGNYVAFVSSGGGLTPDLPDSHGSSHLYLYPRVSGTLVRVTRVDRVGFTQTPRLSADGRYVAFVTIADGLAPEQNGQSFRENVFLYDRTTATVTLVSRSLTDAVQPDTPSSGLVSISADGRFVAYGSNYLDLVPGQTDSSSTRGENVEDVFLFDRDSRTNRLVSHAVSSSTTAAGGVQGPLAISSDGRYVGYGSYAGAIVGGSRDFNRSVDALLYNPSTDTNEIISRREGPPSATGGFSQVQAISADGRYILFNSDAPNLVPGQQDDNDQDAIDLKTRYDVFLYDRTSKAKILVSHAPASPATTGNGPSEALALSPDGRWAVFASRATDLIPGQSDTNDGRDIFLFDRSTGAVTLVSHATASPVTTGDAVCFAGAAISADGQFVAFACLATNLVPGQSDGNNQYDVFIYDRVAGITSLVSHVAGSPTTAAGVNSPLLSLSADGRFVVFASTAPNLVGGQGSSPFQVGNVFLFDRVSGTMTLVSHSLSSPTLPGNQSSSHPLISADGRFIAFETSADDLIAGAGPGVYLFDRLAGKLTFVAPAQIRGISADGRIVAVSNQVSSVFLYDRVSGILTLASHGASPTTPMNRGSSWIFLSADGSAVAFSSSATDALPGFLVQSPPQANVFLFRSSPGAVELVSRALDSPLHSGNGNSTNPVVSADGRFVAFDSEATNLIPGALGDSRSVYLYSQDPAPPPAPAFPCTVFDGPGLSSNVRKVFPVGGTCGVPITAKKVTVKVTASEGTRRGIVQLYPGNVTRRPGTLRFNRRQTVSATFTLALATNGTGTLAILPTVANRGTVHVVVEVLGFTP